MRGLLLGAIAGLIAAPALGADLNCLTCAPDPSARRYEDQAADHRAAQFYLAPDEPFRRLAPAVPSWGDTHYAPWLSDSDRSRPITDPVNGHGGQMLLPLSNGE